MFDLPLLIQKLKQRQSRSNGDLNAMILMKSPDKQIVLSALQEGTKITSFQYYDSITFQIIEGKLNFRTRKGSVILNKGQMVALHENVNYSLISKADTVLLLTFANGTINPAEN
jgi:quercetin dioxygenase-like cupin family protein